MQNINLLVANLVLIPLLSAVFMLAFVRDSSLSKGIYIINSVILFIISYYLGFYIFKKDIEGLYYNIGNFNNSIGIRFRLDLFSSFITLLVTSSNVFYSILQKKGEDSLYSIRIALKLIVITGMMGIAITDDIFNSYVFIELSSIASYILCVNRFNKFGYRSAFEYLTVGSVAGCLILFGIGFIYATFGTLNLTDLSIKIMNISDNKDLIISLTLYSFIFISSGLLMKTGIFPFHSWYIDVHKTSRPGTLSFFSFTSSQVAILFLLKLIYSVYGYNFLELNANYFIKILEFISLISILIGSFYALTSKTIVTLIGWSSVSQAGYVLIGGLSNNKTIFEGIIMLLIGNTISKILIFLTYDKMMKVNGNKIVTVSDLMKFDFSGSRMPLIISFVNLAGLPMTIGFIGKLYIMMGCISSENFPLLIIIIINSVLSAIYSFRLIEAIITGNKTHSNGNILHLNLTKTFRIGYILISIIIISLPFFEKFSNYTSRVAEKFINGF